MKATYIKKALNISLSDAKQLLQLFEVVAEITESFDYEWYMDEGLLTIVYNESLNYVKFPLPEKLKDKKYNIVDTDTPVVCTGFAINLFKMLASNTIATKEKPIVIPLIKVAGNKQAYNEDVINDIKKQLDIDYIIAWSWGISNETPGVSEKGETFYQFDIPDAILYNHKARIVHKNGRYGYQLVNNDGTLFFENNDLSLADAIRGLDRKIEHGPKGSHYKKMVDNWFNKTTL